MTKLNFGCGDRFAQGWVNIDFHSSHPDVRRVNLLKRLPFPDNYFDVVYSSHTLEHFNPAVGERVVRECHRVMKTGGILRTVVPDLENTCREYLRLLAEVDTSELARRQYEWIILELLDQLTRTEPCGFMMKFCSDLEKARDQQMIAYVRSRTDCNPWNFDQRVSLREKLTKVSFNKIKNKLIYLYLAAVKRLLPGSLREATVDNSRIGEKHRWMYDRQNLSTLLQRCGFVDIAFPNARASRIPEFAEDSLDTNQDGSVYKPTSLYCEAVKG